MEDFKMKRHVVILMLLLMGVMVIPAHASNYFCSGTVTTIGLSPANDVVVGGPGGIPVVVLCNRSNATSNGWTADACKAAYATLLAAKLSGQSVSIDFSDSLTCSTQPSWSGYVSVYFITTP
jgi:hypothetical protein